jgi:uroporphyrinogen decarboxylase
MVQVFEAMCEHIDEENFVKYALPSLERIATEIKSCHPDVPLFGFARDAPYGLGMLQTAGYDVITVDAVIGGDAAREQLAAAAKQSGGAPKQLQGNFDPALLHRETGGDEAEIEAAVRKMMKDFGPQIICGVLAATRPARRRVGALWIGEASGEADGVEFPRDLDAHARDRRPWRRCRGGRPRAFHCHRPAF